MVTETTQQTQEAPAEQPDAGALVTQTAPSEPSEPAVEAEATAPESPESAPARKSWEDLRAEIESDEEIKTAYEKDVEERLNARYLEILDEAERRAPQYQQYAQTYKEYVSKLDSGLPRLEALAKTIGNIHQQAQAGEYTSQEVMKAINDAFARNPSAWETMQLVYNGDLERKASEKLAEQAPQIQAQTAFAAFTGTAQYLIKEGARAIGAPGLARQHLQEFEAELASGKQLDGKDNAILRFVKAAYEHGKQEGLKLSGKADTEVAKAAANAGKGPDPAQKGAASAGGPINSMDDADRRYNLPAGHPEKISHQAYKEARKRFGVDQ